MICPNCKKEIADNSRFCGYCGGQIPQTAFCSKCGAECAPGSRFCGRCGAALSAAANTSAQNTADLASALAARREKLTTMRQELEQRTARLAEKQNALAAEAEKQRLAREAEERRKAEEEARLAREAEERRKAEEEARLAREAEERRKAEEEARLAREAEERRKAEEEAHLAREAEEQRKAEEDKTLIAEKAPQKRKKAPLILGIAAAGVAVAVGLCAVLGVFGKKPAPVPEPMEEPEPEVEIVTPDVAVGDHIYYGTYEQDGDATNGAEPIEWRVLDKQGDKVLVISERSLDLRPIDPGESGVTWENCELRQWMNNQWINELFTEEERRYIPLSTVPADENWQQPNVDQGNDTQDYLFLLSAKEVETYFPVREDRLCEHSAVVYGQGHSKDAWLAWAFRTMCVESYSGVDTIYTTVATMWNADTIYVEPGDINLIGGLFPFIKNVIRPAMWLDLTGNENVTVIGSDIDIGDHIIYGSYEQDYNETNGAEPVEWRVLDKDGTKLLVITEFAIGWAPMDGEDNDPTLTWENCEGRRWLNEEMFNDLFTPQQQQAILLSTVTADENWVRPEIDQGNDTQDHLFYLSGKEVKTYFKTPEELKCYKLQREDDGTLYYDRISYWLRTRGVTTHYTEGVFPGFVITFPYGGQSLRFGEPDMEQAQFYYWSQGARPAMWIETRGLNDLTVIKKADVKPVQSKYDTPAPAEEAAMFSDEEIADGLRFRYMSHGDYSTYYTMTYAQACAGYAFSNGRCGGSNWPMQVYIGDYEYSNFECYVENEAMGIAERDGSKVQMWTADIATQREGDTNLVITINGKDYLFPWHAGNDCYGVARW